MDSTGDDAYIYAPKSPIGQAACDSYVASRTLEILKAENERLTAEVNAMRLRLANASKDKENDS